MGRQAEFPSHLAGEQALEEGLPLVAGAVLQVFQGGHRPVREGVQVLRKAALYDACITSSPLSALLLLTVSSGLAAPHCCCYLTIKDSCPWPRRMHHCALHTPCSCPHLTVTPL